METYLLSIPDDANCMSCKGALMRDALSQCMTKSFMNGAYKRHRGQQLFERELALMPSTQPYVEQELTRRNNVRLLNDVEERRRKLKRKLADAERTIHSLRHNLTPPVSDDGKRAFTHKCAVAGCNGFLSTAWRCMVCAASTCSSCGAVKVEEHVCDPAERASFELVKRDSRRCPGCAEYIFKISGCDQMFCTACHTAFSWTTGRKVNGELHNPHYIEWRRRTGGHGELPRDHADIPCGGRPHVNEFLRFCSRLSGLEEVRAVGRDATGLLRVLVHIEQVELRRYEAPVGDVNQGLRVKYSMNELTEEAFKAALQGREKRTEAKRAISMVLRMLVNVGGDLLRQCIVHDTLLPYVQQLQDVVRYANGELEKISKRYSCVVPVVRSHEGGAGAAAIGRRRA